MRVASEPAGGQDPAGHAADAVRGVALTKTVMVGELTREVLRGVDIAVPRGRFVAVVGPSGAGKSTLLNLLGGLDRPTSGEVYVEGLPLGSIDERARTELRRRRIGFVFQTFNLLPMLTAVDNVVLPMVIDRAPTAAREARAAEMLELVGLTDRARQRPSQLSGGEQQRVAIARALVARPALVLADEPTGALDSETSAEILSLFETVRQEVGCAIVMVTHDPTAAGRADEIVEVRDGEVRPTPHPSLGR